MCDGMVFCVRRTAQRGRNWDVNGSELVGKYPAGIRGQVPGLIIHTHTVNYCFTPEAVEFIRELGNKVRFATLC